jgi:cyclopropane fatty-acyl-phospholipid synthase-like methyltransferase
VVDLGCGTGENALYLASRDLDVVGLDGAPSAIERAALKARERELAVPFLLADATNLEALDLRFDAALDCGLFHTFEDAERAQYERGLRSILVPGGRCFLLCFSDREPGSWGPRRVTQAEIRATFGSGWQILAIEPERFAINGSGEGPRAWLCSMVRLAD